MTKRALITGITGQDGFHLAELLKSKNYEIFGVIRGQQNPKKIIVENDLPYVNLIEADLTDTSSLNKAIKDSKPDEVYNLAAISHVGYSFKIPNLVAQVTGVGVLNLLESIRQSGRQEKIRFYQASTSEMFGGLDYNRPGKGYDENALFHPRSPYGAAKLYAHWITKNYRESYGIHASCGILFNHEGPRRGLEFVTRKISNAVARIHLGKQDHIELGNLEPKRDWGFAGDYVEGMWLMLQQEKPDDYVLATGETHSIKDFLELAFKEIGINDWKPYVRQNKAFLRPAEVDILLGNPSKAEKILGWKRRIDFPELVKIMVENDITIEKNKKD
ncbi:MAG: GDP-mannose 4,6-dehydratase [Patescibacteria group bacterium]|jgi:GDPmannose 4,6-dehydratase|nr:GDP-mannose 4,6-dehydratase [Patescibacteria group bacterium]